MHHLIIEYSANLDQRIKMSALVQAVHEAAIATGLVELKSIRTCIARHEIFRIADGQAKHAFAHLIIRMHHGRTPQERKTAGEAIFEVLCQQLASVQSYMPVSISCEVKEIDPELSFEKSNTERWLAAK